MSTFMDFLLFLQNFSEGKQNFTVTNCSFKAAITLSEQLTKPILQNYVIRPNTDERVWHIELETSYFKHIYASRG